MRKENAHPDPERASSPRQHLHKLSKQRQAFLQQLINTDEMIVGSFFEVFKTCSKPNCCCQRGEKHGPFGAISFSSAGKIHHKVVRENDKRTVEKGVSAYKTFQTLRKKLLQTQRYINKNLDTLKGLQAQEYE
jgi:hypothetical protein